MENSKWRGCFLNSFHSSERIYNCWPVYMIIGFTFIVSRFRYNPLCSITPFRNIFHRMPHPSCASVELINRSCLSNASASEQLGPESLSHISQNGWWLSVSRPFHTSWKPAVWFSSVRYPARLAPWSACFRNPSSTRGSRKCSMSVAAKPSTDSTSRSVTWCYRYR